MSFWYTGGTAHKIVRILGDKQLTSEYKAPDHAVTETYRGY